MLSLTSPVTALPGIGPVLAARLKRLGLETVEDLLNHVPSRYEDFSKTVPIAQLKVGEQVTVRAKLQLIKSRRSFRRHLTVTEALLADDTGTVKAVWFNQPYLAQNLKEGQEFLLAGRLSSSAYGLQLDHPAVEPVERLPTGQAGGGVHPGRLVPIYPLTGNLTQARARGTIARLLPLCAQITDWLPPGVKKVAGLPTLAAAIHSLHAPVSRPELIQARRRLAFDELFMLSLKVRLLRLAAPQATAPALPVWSGLKTFVSSLPWPLTPDQRAAAWEIIQDLSAPSPMFRLLQGDVGSGKTIVAGLAALSAAAAGWQVAFLAPTEILAQQHAATLTTLFKNLPHITLGLRTASEQRVANQGVSSVATSLQRQVKLGQVDIVVGTHALLQRSMQFKQLGLVVVDEQHRFGVEQRGSLGHGQTLTPHFLSLSATPIPRSLALTLYGDLKLSTIRQLPAGRKPITTSLVPESGRAAAYQLMRQEVNLGHRVFIVCPTIEESDSLGVRAVTLEHERLSREVFPDLKLGLLHGKLPARAKASVMASFAQGATPILVSTSVIEVGVDVPKATVMAIESAERFGLAQLHQFRGRVGRASYPSFCLLLTESSDPRALKRLEALVNTQSGFDLAEFDLKQRGPGDLLGELQSGWQTFRFASLADHNLLNLVRQGVDTVTAQDQSLGRWPALKAKVTKLTFHPE